MDKIILIAIVAALGYYGWLWFGPLSQKDAAYYQRICESTLPGGRGICACTARTLRSESRKAAIAGLWSKSPRAQDLEQAEILRKYALKCFAQTTYVVGNCPGGPPSTAGGSGKPSFCDCVSTQIQGKLHDVSRRALQTAERGQERFANIVSSDMLAQERNARVACSGR